MSDVNEIHITREQFIECATKEEVAELLRVVVSNSGVQIEPPDYSKNGFSISALDGRIHIAAMRGSMGSWDEAETNAIRLRVMIDGRAVDERMERRICAALTLGKAYTAMAKGSRTLVYEHLVVLAGGVSAENFYRSVEIFWAGIVRSLQTDLGIF